MNIPMLLAFGVYFVTLILIGLIASKKDQTAADYMVGNRSINYWVTAVATQASDMGSWLFLAFPAAVFTLGMFEYWTAIGLVTGMYLNWTFIAPKLRKYSEESQSLTLSSYLSNHFNDKQGLLNFTSTLFSLVFFTFYIASGLVGLSLVFKAAFGISYEAGIITSLCTALLYTLIGGFVSVAWCDFFQGVFLLLMIVLVPAVAFFETGGVSHIIEVAHAKQISLSLLGSPSDTIWAILLAAGWGLGYFGQPHILTNFMGIDNPKKIKNAKRVGISWQIIVLTASAAIGIIGIAMFSSGLSNNEMLFILMTKKLFHPFIAGLILCAILAATLSTMDSLILVFGTMLATDIYQKINPNTRSETLLWLSRAGSIFVSLCALYMAWTTKQTVYDLVNYAWSGLGSTFGPVVIVSLYGKRMSKYPAFIGMIVGGITSGLWPFFNSSILPLVPGFTFSLLSIYATSILCNQK